jgi:hypothetical protein
MSVRKREWITRKGEAKSAWRCRRSIKPHCPRLWCQSRRSPSSAASSPRSMMALCDKLEASLTTADDTRRRLLEALLAEALEPTKERELEAA